MATKRFTQSSINWLKLAERVPPNQKPSYLAFKTKSDKYMRRVMANPESPPTIDWSSYRQKIAIAGLVDTFEKSYKEMCVPYPPDTVTSQVDAQEKEMKAEVADFKKQSEAKIQEYEKKIAYLKSLIPFDQMTMEDFKDSYPDIAIDSIKKPTFWPHDEEEQMDYRDKGHPLYGADPHAEH